MNTYPICPPQFQVIKIQQYPASKPRFINVKLLDCDNSEDLKTKNGTNIYLCKNALQDIYGQ